MNNNVLRLFLRFFFVVLLQVLIFKQLSFEIAGNHYMSVIIYPLFILFLPHKISHSLLVLIGFILGLVVDLFYDSPGVHASATVFMAFIRPIALKAFEPRGGYKMNELPTRHEMGINNFIFYAAVMLFGHLLFYFFMEAFSLVYFGESLMRTLVSFFPSLVFIIIYQYIFNPKN